MKKNVKRLYACLEKTNNILWNNDFKEAEKRLNKTRKVIPSSAILYTECVYVQYAITGKTAILDKVLERNALVGELVKSYQKSDAKKKELFNLLLAENRAAIEAGDADPKRTLEKFSGNDKEIVENMTVDLRVDAAISGLFSGMIQLYFERYLKAGSLLKGSWKEFKALYEKYIAGKKKKKIKLFQTIVEKIQFGYGVFLFIMGYFPSVLQKVLKLVGFKPDRSLGEKILIELIQSKSFVLGFSIYCLFKYSSRFDNLQQWYRVLNFSIENFPNQSIFRYLAAQSENFRGNFNTAIEHLMIAIHSCKSFDFKPLNYIFELAVHYFVLQEFDLAQTHFKRMLGSQFRFDNFTHISLAALECYLGKSESVVTEQYEKSRVLTKDKTDKFSDFLRVNFFDVCEAYCRKGDKKLDVKKATFMLTLMHFQMFYVRRDLDHLPRDLAGFLLRNFTKYTDGLEKSMPENVDAAAWKKFLRAKLLKQCERDSESLKLMLEVVEMKTKFSKYLLPFCKYEIGEIYYFLKDKKSARKWLLEAKKYSKYEFEDDLKRQIEGGLHAVK